MFLLVRALATIDQFKTPKQIVLNGCFANSASMVCDPDIDEMIVTLQSLRLAACASFPDAVFANLTVIVTDGGVAKVSYYSSTVIDFNASENVEIEFFSVSNCANVEYALLYVFDYKYITEVQITEFHNRKSSLTRCFNSAAVQYLTTSVYVELEPTRLCSQEFANLVSATLNLDEYKIGLDLREFDDYSTALKLGFQVAPSAEDVQVLMDRVLPIARLDFVSYGDFSVSLDDRFTNALFKYLYVGCFDESIFVFGQLSGTVLGDQKWKFRISAINGSEVVDSYYQTSSELLMYLRYSCNSGTKEQMANCKRTQANFGNFTFLFEIISYQDGKILQNAKQYAEHVPTFWGRATLIINKYTAKLDLQTTRKVERAWTHCYLLDTYLADNSEMTFTDYYAGERFMSVTGYKTEYIDSIEGRIGVLRCERYDGYYIAVIDRISRISYVAMNAVTFSFGGVLIGFGLLYTFWSIRLILASIKRLKKKN